MLIDKIKYLSDSFFEEIVKIRNYLHQNPELSFQEYQTANFVENYLQTMNIETKRYAKTGVVGIIRSSSPSNRTIALRADLDALPIKEENTIPYKSLKNNIMHACGHDVHTASLLGTAKIIKHLQNQLKINVKFIFQPGEELLPGGANLMIKEGVLKNPDVNLMFAQHVMPEMKVGQIGFREGKYMAATDEIFIKIIGKGGHGAIPHKAIDPVVISAHVILGLQQIVSRNTDPRQTVIITFGKIKGGEVMNVIPDFVQLEGTMRTFDETIRTQNYNRIERISHGIAECMGGKCEIEIKKGYPHLKNDKKLTAIAAESTKEYIGDQNTIKMDLRPTGDDFAVFSHILPVCYYRLGVGNPKKGIIHNVHTSRFNIDEESLKIGMGNMAYILLNNRFESF